MPASAAEHSLGHGLGAHMVVAAVGVLVSCAAVEFLPAGKPGSVASGVFVEVGALASPAPRLARYYYSSHWTWSSHSCTPASCKLL